MDRRARRTAAAATTLALVAATAGCTGTSTVAPAPLPPRSEVRLDALGITVTAAANRPVSFTNKRSAYFYTQTHRNDHPEHAWFAGFNLAQRRIFAGYEISIGGVPLDHAQATAKVFPDRLVRRWPDGVTETLRLVDGEDVVDIELTGVDGPITVRLLGDGVERIAEGGTWAAYSSLESPDRATVVGISGTRIFLVVTTVGTDPGPALADAIAAADVRRARRAARLQGLLDDRHYLWTSSDRRTAALRWLRLTMDQLVTRQRGEGIYAGLPWFNEYWGRDSFIALPGALLVTGEFETARAVLKSFAEFQDLDPASKFHGRVPNIVKVEQLDYHTVDGTPRFIVALQDYLRYSGDRSLVAELYPNIRASIDGALANWVDDRGFLTHADNETWMDARRAGDLAPYSPRGTRANDIQALWHAQLQAGAGFADLMGDAGSAARWRQAADQLKVQFEPAFTSGQHGYLADRLTADGSPDFRLRPNLLYALDLLDDPLDVARITRIGWESLVFPWGVASLAPGDPFFHPFHLAPGRYHKDEAYHNGTVWLWNNGIAMQRMIELGQVQPAWELFENMNEQALARGVVGGLGENMDAWPRPGQAWPRLTGTFLQAWSNSEQLRVWYQYFLGIRPDIASATVTLAPRLPAGFGAVDFSARVGNGSVRGVYRRDHGASHYDWLAEAVSFEAQLDLPGFALQRIPLRPGQRLSVTVRDGEALSLAVFGPDDSPLRRATVRPDPGRQARQADLDRLFQGVSFATPGDPASHPMLQ